MSQTIRRVKNEKITIRFFISYTCIKHLGRNVCCCKTISSRHSTTRACMVEISHRTCGIGHYWLDIQTEMENQKNHLLIILLIAVIGYVISIVAQETGTMLSTAQMGAIITATTPAFMVVFASLILKERLTVKKAISVLLATIGVITIVGIDRIEFSSMIGGLTLVLAALTWALMSVLIKLLPSHYSQIVVTTYATLIAVVVLTPIVLPTLHELDFHVFKDPVILGGLLYLGVISTSIAFLLWNRGLHLLNASSGGIFFFFQPVVGALLGWFLLGETISITFWIGCLFILVGVMLVLKDKDHEKG